MCTKFVFESLTLCCIAAAVQTSWDCVGCLEVRRHIDSSVQCRADWLIIVWETACCLMWCHNVYCLGFTQNVDMAFGGRIMVLICPLYSLVVTICTTSLTFNNSTFCPHSVFICFVWISEQTAIISLSSINWLVSVTETECVYCAVRTGSLYIILRSAHTVYLCVLCRSQNKQLLFPYTTLTGWFL